MKKSVIWGISVLLLGALIGCETAQGMTRDVANTARNIRDILGVGRDIERIAK